MRRAELRRRVSSCMLLVRTGLIQSALVPMRGSCAIERLAPAPISGSAVSMGEGPNRACPPRHSRVGPGPAGEPAGAEQLGHQDGTFNTPFGFPASPLAPLTRRAAY
jgi:hypothetical protein